MKEVRKNKYYNITKYEKTIGNRLRTHAAILHATFKFSLPG